LGGFHVGGQGSGVGGQGSGVRGQGSGVRGGGTRSVPYKGTMWFFGGVDVDGGF
jgi:hypothetical protein